MTPVSIGELSTEVQSDGAPGGGRQHTEQTMPWDELDRARRAEAELAELHARTRAEGFDG
jgi:hypothetical protein